MPMGGKPNCTIKPLTTTLVEVAIRVIELARMAANAMGISKREAGNLPR